MRNPFRKTRACLLTGVMVLTAFSTKADLVGPYTPDADTLFLFHFDEPAGNSSTVNVGIKGGNAYTVQNDSAGNGNPNPPVVTTVLGAAGYASGPVNFGNSANFHSPGILIGYDFDNSGAFEADVQAGQASPDRLAMTNLNIGFNGKSSFTLEALVAPTTLSGNQEIICTDSYVGGNRGFQFRLNGSVLQLQMLDGGTFTAYGATIPASGPHAFVAGEWYHAAATYDGSDVKVYWTRLNPDVTAANQIAAISGVISNGHGAVVAPLVIGNDNRGASGELFNGRIDEIRISKVARGPGEMQFFSPSVTIVANPLSQNIDYNEPVTFDVVAASPTPMFYQWRFNGSPITDATNTSFSIAAVSANDAGIYDVVVTNSSGFASTSAPASLVVGAANFLAHRYSFNGDANDSIGTAHGTNFGNVTFSDGSLVLDGSEETYVQLPGGLLSGLNSVTVDFWAMFGTTAGNSRVFDFGNSITNFTGNLAGFNYLFFSPNSGGNHRLTATPGDGGFEQSVTGTGLFDGRTVHVTCIVDPPNKRLSIYTNGVLEIANTNYTVPMSSLNSVLAYIGKSLYAVDPYLNASIDEFRIYNGALSPITIQQNHEQGPNIVLSDGPVDFVIDPVNVNVPVGQTATFTAAATGYLPIRYQWYKNGVAVPGATNTTLTISAVALDNGATIQAFATNVIGATTYSDASAPATLSVFTPPTLAWIGAEGIDWNTSSLNWSNDAGGALTVYTPFAHALFDARGINATTINLSETVNPDQITANANFDYNLTSFGANGSLTGQGRIVKQNTGTFILDVTNNLSGGVLISGGTLQIGNGGFSGTTGTGAITNNATLAFNRADTLSVPNSISGTGSVQQNGSGSAALSGNNSYSGTTLVNAGTLLVQSSNALGSAAAGTTVQPFASLYITANVDIGTEALTINGSGTDGNGALRKGGAGATTYRGSVSLASDSTIGVDGDATLTLSNTVSGNAILTKTGNGTLALATANTYSGGTILSGGILNVNANAALGSGPVTISGAGRIVLGDGVNVGNAFVADVVSPGVLNGLFMVNDNTNGTVTTISGPITVNASAANGGVFVGPISSGYLNITGKLTNSFTGEISSRIGNVRFSGGGDYTVLDIREGVVSLGAHNGVSTSASLRMAASGPAIFDLNGFNQELTGLSDGAALSETITNSSATASTLTLNLAGGSTFTGTIAGKIALVQNGFGSLWLLGTNAYTGDTTVNGGLLQIAEPTLAAASTVRIANGAMLQLDFSTTNKIAGLVLNGVSQPLGVYNSTTSPAFITGAGSLEVTPAVASYPTNIAVSVSGGNVTISWPASHLGWILQAQTNSLSTGLSDNWVDVPGSASVTQAVIPANPSNPAVFYRLRHP